MIKVGRFIAAFAVLTYLSIPASLSEARIIFHSPYFSSWWNRGTNWLMPPSSFRNQDKKTPQSPIDEDDYLETGRIRVPKSQHNGRESMSSGMNNGVEDMRKRQSDMQAEMKRQRQEMEKQFENLNKKQETPKESTPQAPSNQSKMELPELPTFSPQALPDMKPLQTPEQQALPNVPDLPKVEQPSINGSFTDSSASQGNSQLGGNSQTVYQTPEREPAKIIVDEKESSSQKQTFREEKQESDDGIKISSKTLAVGLAVLFLIMGLIFFLSR